MESLQLRTRVTSNAIQYVSILFVLIRSYSPAGPNHGERQLPIPVAGWIEAVESLMNCVGSRVFFCSYYAGRFH
jgi:hypothetical protein